MYLTKICIHVDLMLLGLYEDHFPLNRLYCEMFWIIMADKKPKIT